MIQLAIYIVIILALVALIYVAAKAMGIPIPNWVVQVVSIIIIAVVIIAAMKFLAGI